MAALPFPEREPQPPSAPEASAPGPDRPHLEVVPSLWEIDGSATTEQPNPVDDHPDVTLAWQLGKVTWGGYFMEPSSPARNHMNIV